MKEILCATTLLVLGTAAASCDEGMWLYDRIPEEVLSERYGFNPDQGWLKHLRLSSVRLGGASAEFVSPEGLILSNHHVGSGAIQRLSTPEQDYMKQGFYAPKPSQELPCPGVEARVLLRIEDVTARVTGALKPGMIDKEAFEARRAAMATIERSVTGDQITGSVVTLFQGAEYHLYVYKRYTDLRLVFAPGHQTAAFGGDADNFEYPRFCLDICFFRAYENGNPAHTEHFLKWSRTGVRENDLILVSGNPGRTDRLKTVQELKDQRDHEFPRTLGRLKSIEVLLNAFSLRSKENERRAASDLNSVQNSRKARDGTLAGLLDPGLMSRKETAEARLRSRAPQATASAWERIAEAQAAIQQQQPAYDLLEGGTAFNSALFAHARRLVRAADEKAKPDNDRLEEYRISNLSSLELALFSPAPIYDDLEIAKLGDSLTYLAVTVGPDSKLAQKVLAGRSPSRRAAELVRGTRLASPSERKRLYEGRTEALLGAKDPMIELARLVDADARELRQVVEVNQEAIRQAHTSIGQARYAALGTNQYPDATGTLRLSFGTVKGYEENGKNIPPWTTFAGLFERAKDHDQKHPFDLSPEWIASRRKLDLKTPLNFVCTADIIGGNSGSPVVNRDGELVGVIFDSNLQGLVADVEYSEEQARAIAVDARGIIEALRKVYDTKALVNELLGTSR